MGRKPVIGVFGSSRSREGEPSYQTAFEVGRAIARAGWDLCNGGYGGVMEASARGAREAGGHTIGVGCDAFRRRGLNAYIVERVSTACLEDRLHALIARSDGYAILPGGTGTLVELATVWELRNKKLSPDKPIVLVGDYWRAVVDAASQDDPSAAGGVSVVAGVEAAMGVLRDALSAE